MQIDLSKKPWHSYAEHDLIELLNQSLLLSAKVAHWDTKFHDYSFVVFSASKAYEGFLKKIFLDLGFITRAEYEYKYFRIGKALNPELDKKYRSKESVYDRLVEYCGGPELANTLWDTWRTCRNILFHWFPNERNAVSFEEAKASIRLIIDAIDQAFAECKIK